MNGSEPRGRPNTLQETERLWRTCGRYTRRRVGVKLRRRQFTRPAVPTGGRRNRCVERCSTTSIQRRQLRTEQDEDWRCALSAGGRVAGFERGDPALQETALRLE